jgi:DNA polymerase I
MWILDSVSRGGVDLWYRDGTVKKVHYGYDPPFYLHLPDPHPHHGMIEALESEYRAEECTFTTIFGDRAGYKVFAGRPVAEAIEQQTRYEAQLFNVDVRIDQRFMAERGIFPCGTDHGSRFSPDLSCDLRLMEIRIDGNPALRYPCHSRADRMAARGGARCARRSLCARHRVRP